MLPRRFRHASTALGLLGLVFMLAWISAGAAPALATTANEESRAYYEKALEQAQKGDLRAAVIELKNALQRDPDNAEARAMLGEVYTSLGDGAAAEKELRAAGRLGIDAGRLAVPLGRALLLQRDFAAVLEAVPAPAPGAPGALDALMLRAEAHGGLEQWEAARADYDNAAKAAPADARVPVGLGRLELAQRHFAAAEAQADAALKREPGLPAALLLQAEARRLDGRPEAALEPFRAALASAKLPPDVRLLSRLGLASALIALGRDDEAKQEVAAVRAQAPDLPLGAYLDALVKVRAQDYEGARGVLEAAQPALQNFVPAQFLYAAVNYQAGRLETARSWLNRFLAAQPDNLKARKLQAATLLRLNAAAEAAKTLEPAYKAAPDDPQVLLLLGSAYLRSGRAAEASELLKRAAEQAPKDPRVLGQLTLSLLATGQRSEAQASLDATLDLGVDASVLGFAVAFEHLRAGEFKEALAVAQDLRRHFPKNALAANLEGGAHAAMHQLKEARAAFEAAIAIDPGFYEARTNLASLKAQGGDLAGAEADYQAVVKAQPGNLPALMGLASIAERNGDRDGARGWLESAAKANPDDPRAALALAKLQVAGGDLPAALQGLEAFAGRQPKNPQVLLALGDLQRRTGQAGAAVETFKRLVEATGRSTGARLLLAETQVAAGELDAARSSYEGLKADAGDNATVWNNLAWLYQQAGDDRALAHGERALELAPDQPAVMDTLGWILVEKGDLARATDLLKRAHAGAPGSGDIAFHYAAALHKGGDDAAARDLLRPLLAGQQPFASRTEAADLLSKLGG